MGRNYVPLQIMVHRPTTEEGRAELAKKIGNIHGDMAAQQIAKLDCPTEQKTKLLRAILDENSRQ